MHFSVLVLIHGPDEITEEAVKSAVESQLASYGDGRKWDWYQIGGRWTGLFDGYDPDKDPANVEVCNLCGGTGDRATWRREPKAGQHPSGCNGCLGKGKRTTWPTQWSFHAGDVQPVAALTQEQLDKFYAVCDGSWYGGEEYLPWKRQANGTADYDAMFPRRESPPLDWIKGEYPEHLAVVVDCHK